MLEILRDVNQTSVSGREGGDGDGERSGGMTELITRRMERRRMG